MRALVLAAVSLVLAGCATPALTPAVTKDAAAPVDGPRPDVVVPKFSPAILLDTVRGGAEPNLAIHEDHVYITSPLHLWRSEDGGKTFKTIGKDACSAPGGVTPPACPGPLASKNPGLVGGGDGALVADANGNLSWAGLGTGVPVQTSSDKGDSWSAATDVANKNSSDREWVAIDHLGNLHVSWRDFGGQGATPEDAWVTTRASTDGGKTFGPAIRIAPDGHQGPIAPDPNANWLYVPHVLGSDKLKIAVSNDSGVTWEDHDVAPLIDDTFQFPIAAVDSAGTVYIVYANGNFNKANNYQVDRLPNVPAIMLTHSKDHGATWSKPVPISTSGNPAVFPWIAAGAPGRVAIAFYEGALPLPLAAPNQWHVAVVQSTSADSDAPKLARAYVTTEPNHVGQICVVGASCTPQDRSLLDFFEIRLFKDGTPALTYTGDAEAKQQTVKVYFAKMSDGTKLR